MDIIVGEHIYGDKPCIYKVSHKANNIRQAAFRANTEDHRRGVYHFWRTGAEVYTLAARVISLFGVAEAANYAKRIKI